VSPRAFVIGEKKLLGCDPRRGQNATERDIPTVCLQLAMGRPPGPEGHDHHRYELRTRSTTPSAELSATARASHRVQIEMRLVCVA